MSFSPKRFRTIVVEEPAVVDLPEVPTHLPRMTKALLLMGRATFAVTNPEGLRMVFKIKGLKGTYKGADQVSYLLSVDAQGGTFPFRYVGIVLTDGVIKSTGKSQYLRGTKEFDVAQWAVHAVFHEKLIPVGYEIQHAGKCCQCSKTLLDPISLEHGTCPACSVP